LPASVGSAFTPAAGPSVLSKKEKQTQYHHGWQVAHRKQYNEYQRKWRITRRELCHKWRAAHKERADIELTCRQCGEKYYVPLRRKNASKYCSAKCCCLYVVKHGLRKGKLSGGYRGGRAKKSCLVCRKLFEFSPSATRWERGKYCSRKCYIIAKSGSKSPWWKGGVTPLSMQIRHHFKSRQWKSDVFTRDNFVCQKCGNKGGRLNAHHVVSFSKIIAKREIKTLEQAVDCKELWSINNGITLCEKCHYKLHEKYWENQSGGSIK
jgi:hypothetical protein